MSSRSPLPAGRSRGLFASTWERFAKRDEIYRKLGGLFARIEADESGCVRLRMLPTGLGYGRENMNRSVHDQVSRSGLGQRA